MNCSPSLIYKNAWFSQTSSLGTVSAFTASSTGMYRFSVIANATAGGTPPVTVEFGFSINGTDYLGTTVSPVGATSETDLKEINSGDVVDVYANITQGTATYDFLVSVEQLA